MGNFPPQDSGYQLPPGTTAGQMLDDGFNPQGGPGGPGGEGDQACFMWQQVWVNTGLEKKFATA